MIPDTLKTVFSIAETIYAQVQTCRVNSRQCKTLSARITVIVDSLEGLDKTPDNRQFEVALVAFQAMLTDTSGFIANFTKKSRVIRFIKAGSYKDTFADLNTRLQRCMADLQLGLSVQQIKNRDQDLEDERADLSYIKQHEREILAACENLQEGLVSFRGYVAQRDRWVEERLLSMRQHLLDMSGGISPAPSPAAYAGAGAPPAVGSQETALPHPSLASRTDQRETSLVVEAKAAYDLGVASEEGGDFSTALVHYRKAIEVASYPKANTRIGLFYLRGKAGLDIDKNMAAQHLERGAAHDHPQALHTLGQMLEYGDGIPQDLRRAGGLYRRLLDHGESTVEQKDFARTRLGRIAEKLGQ